MLIGKVLSVLEQLYKVVLHGLIGDIYGRSHGRIVQIKAIPLLWAYLGMSVFLKRKRRFPLKRIILRLSKRRKALGFGCKSPPQATKSSPIQQLINSLLLI